MLMVILPFNLRSISLLAWISRPKLRSSEPWFVETFFFFPASSGASLTSGIPNSDQTPRGFNQRQGRTSRKLWKTTTTIATSFGREIFAKRLGEMYGKFFAGLVTVEARCVFVGKITLEYQEMMNKCVIHTKEIQLHVIFMHVHD